MAIRTTQVTADAEGDGSPAARVTQVTADVEGVVTPVARVTQVTVDVMILDQVSSGGMLVLMV